MDIFGVLNIIGGVVGSLDIIVGGVLLDIIVGGVSGGLDIVGGVVLLVELNIIGGVLGSDTSLKVPPVWRPQFNGDPSLVETPV